MSNAQYRILRAYAGGVRGVHACIVAVCVASMGEVLLIKK